MCLSTDGRFLITGDVAGSIYKWTIKDEQTTSLPLSTFDIHKDHGAVTNLVAISRPLSLFGLTANMQGYEPGDLRPLQKQLNQIEQQETFSQIGIQTNSCNAQESSYLDELAELEELQFISEAS